MNPSRTSRPSRLKNRGAAQLINQDSGDVEWYTPPEILDVARAVLGGFDLDPFSCAVANERVQAARFFTKEDDALKQEWFGRVWMKGRACESSSRNTGADA